MVEFLAAEGAVKLAETFGFFSGKRAAPCSPGELNHRLEVTWLGLREIVAEAHGSLEDRLAQRLHLGGIATLGDILGELFEGIDQTQRSEADPVEPRPQPVEFGGFAFI